MKNSRSHWLLAKIHSEEYCCLKGYLGLCAARNETAKNMAKNINISVDTIWYHYRQDRKGKINCQRLVECLSDTIEIIKAEKILPEQDSL